jgi:hypothetical protein
MKVIKNIIFSLIPLVILLGIIEIGARIIGKPKSVSPSSELQNIYNQKAITGTKDNVPVSSQLNKYGFRGRELNFTKKIDDYVIVILGGSVATGAWAAKFENTPAIYIETHFKEYVKQKYNKNLVVYSLAESGSDIEDEAFWLLKLGVYLQPDAVVSITAFNNMSNATLPMWDKSSGGRAFQRAMLLYKPDENEGVLITAKKFVHANYLLLVKLSRAMEWVDYLLFAEKIKNDANKSMSDELAAEKRGQKKMIDIMAKTPKPDTMPTMAAQRFKQTVAQIGEICKHNQSKYFVVLQPFRDSGKNNILNLPLDGTQDSRSQFLYRTLMKTWNTAPLTVPYLDASHHIGDQLTQEQQFGDDCHLWDNGFILLNQTIVDWLKQNL